ncbi:nucleoside triphosphate pyrophosphohydrolase [Sessilibacter sp. MAH1]
MHSIDDLKYLMARLRDPDSGCPWDLKQDFHTITNSTIEEAYEVADTIERGDLKHLSEELGDLLFQVIFYSQLAKERDLFDFDVIVDNIVTKLVRRHPHVFPEGNLHGSIDPQDKSDSAVKTNWEQIKADERKQKGQGGILDDVPVGLPSLTRAEKLQKRVARAGWDWRSLQGVLDKIDEEVAEIKEAIHAAGSEQAAKVDPHVREELGDLMFMTVNLSRYLGIDAEGCLRENNRKFERRVKGMESVLLESGIAFNDASDEQLDAAWEAVKLAEKSRR